MATDPVFASTPNTSACIIPGTADASLTAPTNVATLFTAGANGSKVEEIRSMQIASTSAIAVVNVFLYDGSTYYLYDQFTTPITTLSATSEATPVPHYFDNLVLKSGWSIRVTVTATASVSKFAMTAHGADF